MKTKTKLVAVIALALMTSTAAFAQHGGRGGYNGGNNFNRGGHNTYVQNNYHGGYRGGYNNYNRGGYYGGGNGWGVAGALLGGAIIGGAIASAYSQPYYAPAPVYVAPPVYAPDPVYVTPDPVYVVPQPQLPWHWEKMFDANCNCYRNVQVMN